MPTTPTGRRPPPAAVLLRCCCCLILLCCCFFPACRAFPLCTDARAPLPLNGTLAFCGLAGATCCDAAADKALRDQLQAANVSDAACAAVLKSLLCAKCNPYSAELFDAGPKLRTIPFLCNSASSATSAHQSKESTVKGDYCKLVWETCKDVTIRNSPFQPPLQGGGRLPSSSSKLTDAWQSEADFCTSFGGVPSDRSVCLSGSTVSLEPHPFTLFITFFFRPTDGYLYLMMGDGGQKGDPFNFAQNKKSLLGKIMRLDIDSTPGLGKVTNQSLWGNYSIPKDNPFSDDSGLAPEIWALGVRNPWRCSFDLERPSYFYCADTGQDQYEEVDLISKAGNYGWRIYEGPLVYHPPWTPGGNTSLKSVNVIPPIMGYSHSDVNKNIGSASIMGGYVYRGSTDPCLYGRYLYADLYASAMWTGTETPESSGNYTSSLISFSCSKNSPIPCDSAAGSPLPSLGYIYSFGEDNNKDIYVLASKGVYRIVRPSLCSYTCPTEKPVTNNGKAPAGPSSNAPAATGMGMKMGALLLSAVTALFFMR